MPSQWPGSPTLSSRRRWNGKEYSAQIRGAVFGEAILAGLVATIAALLAGAAFAALLIGVINPQSFGWSVVPSVPFGRLAVAAAIVLAASLLAGFVPGRIAASADPASALAEE